MLYIVVSQLLKIADIKVPVTRKEVHFFPDASRIVARYFMNDDASAKDMLTRICSLGEEEVHIILNQTLRDFAYRHRNITELFKKHYKKAHEILGEMQVDFSDFSSERKLLMGAYLTMEYSIESTAFFNPSIIPDIDQRFLEEGEMRVILSFRATGEGHISSIVFRRAVLDKNNDLNMMGIGKSMDIV